MNSEGLQEKSMEQEDPFEVTASEPNMRGIASGIASYWLGIIGFFCVLGRAIGLCYFVWTVGIVLGVASLAIGAKTPRRKGWFVRGTIGIVVALSGLRFLMT